MFQPSRAAAFSGAAVVVAALAAFTSSGGADAAPLTKFADPGVHRRPVHAKNGPFFALRVHSMDVAADAETLSSFEYACDDFVAGGTPERYDLVRTLFRGTVTPTECDEVLGILVPKGAKAEYRARFGTTRWMRRAGPAGTPVGGFVGRMEVAATVTHADAAVETDLPVLDLRIVGTTGMRPMRGDPDDATLQDEDRCRAPRHDEGWYVGGFSRRTLAHLLEKGDADDAERIRYVRTLARAIVAGTFEGRLKIDPQPDDRFDYANVAAGAWWWDGLAGVDCRPAKKRPADRGDVAGAGDL